jgi:hypothetical protein
MQFVRRRRSVREFSDKQEKKLKKTLDTAGVVRDSAFTRPRRDAMRRNASRNRCWDIIAQLIPLRSPKGDSYERQHRVA